MADETPRRLVICSPATLPSVFTNDRYGYCALCDQRVRFRPYIPTKHILICLECFLIHAEPGTECEILGDTVAELRTLMNGDEPLIH